MTTTYNVSISDRACRIFKSLKRTLLASHPQSEHNSIRIITTILGLDNGTSMYPNALRHSYIRIVIDIPKGRIQNLEHKQELLRKTTEACLTYEGRKASKCEVEVRINEMNEEDIVRVLPTKERPDKRVSLGFLFL